MEKPIVHVYLPEGFADWETGFILPELRTGRWFRKGTAGFDIRFCALEKGVITSMGGLPVECETQIDDITKENAAMLIIPGSMGWMTPDAAHERVFAQARTFLGKGIPVACICGATIAMARAGFLDDRAHTSNDLSFLKMFCPTYRGEALYRNEPAVVDKGLITASAMAPLEFARCILEQLNVVDAPVLEAWHSLYKTGDSRFYLKLMELMGQ